MRIGRLESETPRAMTAEFERAFTEIATHKRESLKLYASRWGPERAEDAVQEGLPAVDVGS